jgi:hypothetical protein
VFDNYDHGIPLRLALMQFGFSFVVHRFGLIYFYLFWFGRYPLFIWSLFDHQNYTQTWSRHAACMQLTTTKRICSNATLAQMSRLYKSIYKGCWCYQSSLQMARFIGVALYPAVPTNWICGSGPILSRPYK